MKQNDRRNGFVRRRLHRLLFGMIMFLVSLAVGIIGFRLVAGYDWIECILNASLTLSGIGGRGYFHNDATRIFVSVFALYSGVFFIIIFGLVVDQVLDARGQ